MSKTLAEFRAKNLRLLEQLCPEDPRYIQTWLKQFDKQNGIEPETGQLTLAASRFSASKSKGYRPKKRVRP